MTFDPLDLLLRKQSAIHDLHLWHSSPVHNEASYAHTSGYEQCAGSCRQLAAQLGQPWHTTQHQLHALQHLREVHPGTADADPLQLNVGRAAAVEMGTPRPVWPPRSVVAYLQAARLQAEV